MPVPSSSTRCKTRASPLWSGRRLVRRRRRRGSPVAGPAPPPGLLRGFPMACVAGPARLLLVAVDGLQICGIKRAQQDRAPGWTSCAALLPCDGDCSATVDSLL